MFILRTEINVTRTKKALAERVHEAFLDAFFLKASSKFEWLPSSGLHGPLPSILRAVVKPQYILGSGRQARVTRRRYFNGAAGTFAHYLKKMRVCRSADPQKQYDKVSVESMSCEPCFSVHSIHEALSCSHINQSNACRVHIFIFPKRNNRA